ncbi:hypothetical protein [Lacticaseibacillus paracasei]|uniref:hypothetical protein n=1 Tax=Lacticaseibacillus paracasei TaxID=1597 RepID=UPI000CA23101|nr:hypothetical protein [Lacticaseibacillus paracasei]AUB99798.1 hypothetical protein BBD24_01890 [Lacticaseibacillus paracasei subsp. paracasei]MDH7441437.1 hypothetical protein [Lacticaseibacillus paracasei subsp. paracasei]
MDAILVSAVGLVAVAILIYMLLKKNDIKMTLLSLGGLKSIFETDFKGHSEPRLPSTAQINHQLRLITYLSPGKH